MGGETENVFCSSYSMREKCIFHLPQDFNASVIKRAPFHVHCLQDSFRTKDILTEELSCLNDKMLMYNAIHKINVKHQVQ
jgi:hypothetical protein